MASLIRFTWFIQPYYVEASTERLFGQTFETHLSVTDTLLRYAQVSMFIVLLLQIKSWRQTVRNTRKLKRTNSVTASRRTVAKAAEANVMLEMKIDTIVITSAIFLLIISAVLSSVFRSSQVFLYVSTIYIVMLLPSSIYYVYKFSYTFLQ